jgi:hypothetical protein
MKIGKKLTSHFFKQTIKGQQQKLKNKYKQTDTEANLPVWEYEETSNTIKIHSFLWWDQHSPEICQWLFTGKHGVYFPRTRSTKFHIIKLYDVSSFTFFALKWTPHE